MKRYQPKTFRPAYGFACAAVMTALTLVLSVAVPAGLASAGGPESALESAAARSAGVVTIGRMDVVMTRAAHVAETTPAPRG